jgi:hypothetical protein
MSAAGKRQDPSRDFTAAQRAAKYILSKTNPAQSAFLTKKSLASPNPQRKATPAGWSSEK